MRVLHIISSIDPETGGPAEAVRTLLEFGPSGYEHEIVTLDDPAAPFLRNIGVPVHALGPVATVYGHNKRLVPWLVANRIRFDGVFVHGLWQYCGRAAMHALHGHTPYAVFSHGMLDPYFKRRFPLKHLKKWLYWLPVEYWVLRRAYRVLFTCKAEEKLAEESFFLHRWTPYTVAFGASAPTGDPDQQRNAFFERCSAARARRFLLFLGRIHPKKGCDLLIEAFLKVAAEAPELDLVIAGPDQQQWQASLMETVAKANLMHRVHWTGMLKGDAKWGAFLASEAFILPSHQENFGIAVAESLACGRSVLLSDKVNIAPDIAADGAGLMELDTPEGTLGLLRRWLALSPAERETMGQRARETFERRYDMRTNAQAIVRIFEGA